MRNKLLYLIFLTCVASHVSCSDQKDSETEAKRQESAALIVKTVESEDSIKNHSPKLSLNTSEEQLKYMKSSDSWSKYSKGILPQMAKDVPDYCRQILEDDSERFIIVDKGKMKLFLYDKFGNIIKSCGIACARNYGTKHKKGDSRTTEGFVRVKGVHDATDWLFTNDFGQTSPTRGVYGPRFIRLTIPYIGIHGTGSPGSIGNRTSHGCIRVTNDNITELVKYVQEGMPVIISPGPRDMAVNASEGSYMPSVATEPGDSRATPGKNIPVKATVNSSVSTQSGKKSEVNENTEEKTSAPENPVVKEEAPAKESSPENAI